MALSHSEIQSLKWARARGLDKLGRRVGDITKVIDSLLKGKRKIRVLEVGFGFGRVLMELQKIYGNKVELYGMSKRRGHGDWKDIKKVAVEEGIFSEKEIKKIPKPSLHFGDIDEGLPFKTNSFDFVYSQVSFFYYKDKKAGNLPHNNIEIIPIILFETNKVNVGFALPNDDYVQSKHDGLVRHRPAAQGSRSHSPVLALPTGSKRKLRSRGVLPFSNCGTAARASRREPAPNPR